MIDNLDREVIWDGSLDVFRVEAPADLREEIMATDETSVKVRVVTIAGVLIGKMSKPKKIRTLDALNLKGDFFALTEAVAEGEAQSRPGFLAVNKRQVVSLEEIQ
jgi:hypothetical protein